MKIGTALIATMATTILWAVALAKEPAWTVTLNIRSQHISSALMELGKQAGLQVLVRGEDIGSGQIVSPALSGEFTVPAALDRILTQSGLTYEFLDERTVRVLRAKTEGTPMTSPAASAFRTAQAESLANNAAPGTDSQEPNNSDSGSSAQRASPAGLEEVVVTAQKKIERLQDVPISISVLGGQELDQSTFSGVSEALTTVPGVAAIPTIQGGGTQVVVRGVVSGYALYSGSSPVGYYLDSAPFGAVRSSIFPDSNPYDLDRVEVLRGPQGTLYGAGSLDGVVRILTKDPDLHDFDFKGRTLLSTTESGGANYGGDLVVNMPIVDDKLAARLVVGQQDLSGWIDSPIKLHVNDEELTNVRLKIKAQPTDDLSIVLFTWHSQDHEGAPPVSDANGNNSTVDSEPINTTYNTYGAKVEYNAGAFLVSSNSSYFKYANDGYWSFDVPEYGFYPDVLHTQLKTRVFTEEINLTSRAGSAWNWSAGVFYRDARDTNLQYNDGTTGAALSTNFDDFSKSYAIFGEIGRCFLQGQFGWTLGVRQFRDDNGTQANGPLAGLNVSLNPMKSTFNNTAPRAVLSWYPNSDLTAYASFSEGFRSGFAQDELAASSAIPPVKPDKLYNYELGAKGSILDHRISFDTALYYMDWRSVQQAVGIPDPSTGGVTFIVASVNGADASGAGIDFSLTFQPIEALKLGVTASWNDLGFNQSVLGNGGLIEFRKGDRPAYSPESTVGAFGQYGFPIGASGFRGLLTASINRTSAVYTKQLEGGAYADNYGNNILVSRAAFAIESPNRRWVATLYGDNLNNERGSVLNEGGAVVPEWDVRVRPRTFGVQLDYHVR